MDALKKLPSWCSTDQLEIGAAPLSLILISGISLMTPILGWVPSDFPSRPMRQLFDDPAGLSWATFAILWSLLGSKVDIRVLLAPLLIACCWGAGESGRNLNLLLPHFLWCLGVLACQKAGWFRFLGLWIALDAIWLWYAPFFFPFFPYRSIGPITYALISNLSLSQLAPGLVLTLLISVSAIFKSLIWDRDSRT